MRVLSRTECVFEGPGDKRRVAVEQAERVVLGVLQHEAQAEAVMATVLRVQRHLAEDVPQLSSLHSAHQHQPKTHTVEQLLVYFLKDTLAKKSARGTSEEQNRTEVITMNRFFFEYDGGSSEAKRSPNVVVRFSEIAVQEGGAQAQVLELFAFDAVVVERVELERRVDEEFGFGEAFLLAQHVEAAQQQIPPVLPRQHARFSFRKTQKISLHYLVRLTKFNQVLQKVRNNVTFIQ